MDTQQVVIVIIIIIIIIIIILSVYLSLFQIQGAAVKLNQKVMRFLII